MTAWIKEHLFLWTLIVAVAAALFLAAPLAVLVAKVHAAWKARKDAAPTTTGTSANAVAQKVAGAVLLFILPAMDAGAHFTL